MAPTSRISALRSTSSTSSSPTLHSIGLWKEFGNLAGGGVFSLLNVALWAASLGEQTKKLVFRIISARFLKDNDAVGRTLCGVGLGDGTGIRSDYLLPDP